jgi:hypothetical protein
MESAGDIGWPGASGTNWWADPKEELRRVHGAFAWATARWSIRRS